MGSCRPCGRANQAQTRTQRIGRPPRRWIRRCIRGVEKSGGADPKLGGPGAVCGNVWYHKLTPKRRAEIRKEYEAKGMTIEELGRKLRKRERIRERLGGILGRGKQLRAGGPLRAEVYRRYGIRGFDQVGRIHPDVLIRMAREPGVWGDRARGALNLRRGRR